MNELLEILAQFGGGRGDPGNNVVRFLLPSVFWAILALTALRQWARSGERKDLYIGAAALSGLSRELLMFVVDVGDWLGYVPKSSTHPLYPPLEHAISVLAYVFAGYAFLRYFSNWRTLARAYLAVGVAGTVLLYLLSAPSWAAYLGEQPAAKFGEHWGDMAFRISGALLTGSALGALLLLGRGGKHVPRVLYLAFLSFFLDDALMIVNLAQGEVFKTTFAPIRHNLHIWAIPMLFAVYWVEMSRANDILRHEVTERERVQQLREEYVSLISHDLRAPLTVILGQAQWLSLALAKQGAEHLAKVAEIIAANGKRMNGMIADMVDSARLESGKLELREETLSLREMLQGIVEKAVPPADLGRVRLEAEEDVPPVLADGERLQRVLVNLLTNALKFSAAGRSVIVRMRRQGDEAVVSVIDEGIGISAEELPRVFERFYRAKTAGRWEGVGLGLYVSRLIVEAHGGRIWVESGQGKGSTFHFTLPLARHAEILKGAGSRV